MNSQINIKSREVITHILIWVCIYGIVLFQYYIQFEKISNGLIIRALINIVLFYFNYFFLVPKFVLNKKITIYVVVSLAIIAISVFLAETLLLPEFPKGPMPNDFQGSLRPMPRKGSPGPGFIFLLMPAVILAFNFVVGAMLKIYVEWNRNEVSRKKVENEKVTSELQFLKTQLNPHFLFNSLNAIYSLSVKKSADTSEAIINLSELMRYMLYEANQDLVSLEKELNYIKNYVQLQRLRLSNSENVDFNVFGNEKGKEIPPLLFISFIENAFKYGTNYQGVTNVKITITIENDFLHLYVKNIIGSFRKQDQNSGVGLQNVKNRLNLLYPNSHELEVKDLNDEYIVDLKLNLNEYEVYNN